MRRLWTSVEIAVPAATAWRVLVDLDAWPQWGPSVRGASVEGGRLADGARGRVQTTLGPSLPFEITTFEPPVRWAWSVGGVEATDHRVDPLGRDRCRVSFGVPWPAAPYLAVCRLALARIVRACEDDTP